MDTICNPAPPAAELQAIAQGYTKRVYIDGGFQSGEFLIKPDTDLDTRFKAYGTDWAEWTWVAGYNVSIEEM